uniref:Uncharacterized protein n=1 Tax=Junco hyemalis TaxID=40217 RepID=A0A8C5ID20_JUNHY
MEVAGEAQRLLTVSVWKLYRCRVRRGGLRLHRSLQLSLLVPPGTRNLTGIPRDTRTLPGIPSGHADPVLETPGHTELNGDPHGTRNRFGNPPDINGEPPGTCRHYRGSPKLLRAPPRWN